MEKEKWQHIFNNCLRMHFCAYLEWYERDLLRKIDFKYITFLKQNHLSTGNSETADFFGGDFYISFAYHSLVRVLEFLNKQKEIEVSEFLSSLKMNFSEILNKKNLKVSIPKEKDLLSTGFENFIKKLRHALSHSNYSHPDYHFIKLWNINNNGNKNFEVIFQYDAFLNLCKDFGFEVNEELIRRGFFETK